jgi:hypothetical protein
VNDEAQDPENIPAGEWLEMLRRARWYMHQEKVRKAIAAIKPRKKKPKVQMPGVQALDYSEGDQENDPDSDLS